MPQIWETTFSLQELDQISVKLLQHLSPHESVLLAGDMGSGKTTIVSTIMKTLGYDGVVTSPTYTLMHCYAVKEITMQVESLLQWNMAKKFASANKTDNAGEKNKEKESSRAVGDRSANSKRALNVYHFDLYRLADDAEFYHLGIDELFSNRELLFIEWGEKNALCVSKADKILKIDRIGDEERKLSLKTIDHRESF